MFQTADATTSASASLQHDVSRAVGLAALKDLKEKGKKVEILHCKNYEHQYPRKQQLPVYNINHHELDPLMRFLIQFENCEVAAHKGLTPQTMSIHPSPTASPMSVFNCNYGHPHRSSKHALPPLEMSLHPRRG